jgi:tetratricopeptide (TPR) repeat protein
MRMTTKGRRWILGSLLGLFVWGVWVMPALSSQLTEITVERVQNDTNVIIRGGYSSYRAFTLPKPARLVIDFEGTSRAQDLPRLHEISDPVISKIRVGEGTDRVRIVFDSTIKDEPFHFSIGEEEGAFRLRCWRAERAATAKTEVKRSSSTGDQKMKGFPQKALRDVLGLTQSTAKEEPEGKKIPKYPGAKIDHIDFYQEDLHNVFRLFGEMFGKNFIVDDRVKGTLTLSLKDVPWDLAMDIIADMNNLEVIERADILVVRPKEEKEEGELVVKSVSDEALNPARILKKQKEEERRARDLILKGHNLEQEGRIEEALKYYEKAFAAWKKNIDLIKKTAYLHYNLAQYARSYFYAKEGLKLNMKDAEVALYAALSAAQMNKKDEAELFFEASVNGEPKLPEAFYNYGLFLEQEGKFTDALRVYEMHEEIFGPSLEVSLAIAKVLEAKNRDSEACKRYRSISFSGFRMDEATENMIQQKVQTLCD